VSISDASRIPQIQVENSVKIYFPGNPIALYSAAIHRICPINLNDIGRLALKSNLNVTFEIMFLVFWGARWPHDAVSRPSTSLQRLIHLDRVNRRDDFLWKTRYVRPLEALVSIQNTRQTLTRSRRIKRYKLVFGLLMRWVEMRLPAIPTITPKCVTGSFRSPSTWAD
jgi:hypothetical protein